MSKSINIFQRFIKITAVTFVNFVIERLHQDKKFQIYFYASLLNNLQPAKCQNNEMNVNPLTTNVPIIEKPVS